MATSIKKFHSNDSEAQAEFKKLEKFDKMWPDFGCFYQDLRLRQSLWANSGLLGRVGQLRRFFNQLKKEINQTLRNR